MSTLPLLIAVVLLGVALAFVAIRNRRLRAGAATLRRDAAQVQRELEEVRFSAQRLSLAVERLPVGVAAFDKRGGVLFANTVASRYVAARHGEAVVELGIRRIIESVITEGQELEESFEVHAGGKRHLFVTAMPVVEGGDVAALVVIEDQTQRHRVDEIRRDFVANVSHELKTPLGALSVLAETLEGELDQEVRDRLTSRIAEEANRMGRLIEDILDLSHVEAESFEPALVPLNDVVRAVAKRARPSADELGVEIALSVPESDVKIMGDVRQLESAVGNLVDNAVKYTAAGRDGAGTVTVTLEADADEAAVTVVDEGIGIAREHLDRIFERFYRVDRGRSRQTGGTGLGLAIVRHVVLNHGGSVSVESLPGEGSTFVIRLPYDYSQ